MRILRASLLLASLALPAAAESRFGLGLDLLFERQESLEVASFHGTILTRNLLHGGEQSGAQPGDPALLNRKFDLLWELEGAGVELPIHLPGLGGLSPRAVLQAGVADVSLDFLGRRDPADSTALSGRGPLFGVELELAGSPWGGGPWSLGATLRWQKLSTLTMDRSPAFGPEGFAVTGDEVRLSQEVREVTTRAGYSVSGKTTSYLGVRHRRTDVTIDDELGFVDPLREIETSLTSRTELNSEATLAVAGVETRIGERFQGRIETAVGEGDRVVLVRMVTFLGAGASGLPPQRAARLAEELGRIRAEFESEIQRLTGMPEAAALVAAHELLRRLEAELLAAFAGPDFAAMRDYVQERFAQARALLPPAATTASVFAPAVAAAYRQAAAPTLRLARQGTSRNWLTDLAGFLGPILERLEQLAVNNDLYVDVCVRSQPAAFVTIQPRRYADLKKTVRTDNVMDKHPRGLYVYQYKLTPNSRGSECRPGEEHYDARRCPSALDLVGPDRPDVVCELEAGFAVCVAEEGDREACGARRRGTVR